MNPNYWKDKIEDTQKQLDQAQGDIAELIGIADAEERDLTDVEKEQINERSDAVETLKSSLTTFEKAEKAQAERVIEKQAPAIVKHQGHVEREPGELIFKQATAAYLAHVNRMPIEVAAQKAYPNDRGLHAVVKTAIDPADTTTTGWAAELTEEANRGYLDVLRGASVTPQLWAVAGVNLQFDGYTALNIPSRAGTDTDLASGWTPEGGAIPIRKATYGTQKIEPYKWAAITTMTKEIMTRSTPAIQALITADMVKDTATKLDNDYLGAAAAVAGFNPAGVMNGVTGTPAATGGATVGDDMLTDLRNLIDPFYAANMGQTLRIMMHPSNALAMSVVLYNGTYLFRDELARGTLFGIPVIQSTNIPTDELQAIDMAHQAVSSGPISVEVNDSATIVEYDDDTGTDPHMDAGSPRSPNTGTVSDAINAVDAAGGLGNVRSLYQTETVAIKNVQYLSWAVLRSGSVNRITGVSY
jgi:hypothetical protein